MAKLLLLILLWWIPMQASADNLFLTLGSHHTSSGNYCETNPGFLYEFNNKLMLGSYRNSSCDWVGVAAKNSYQSKYFFVNQSKSYVIVPIGVVVGYESYPIIPLIMPTIIVEMNSHISLAFSVIPVKEPVFGFGVVIHQW